MAVDWMRLQDAPTLYHKGSDEVETIREKEDPGKPGEARSERKWRKQDWRGVKYNVGPKTDSIGSLW